MGELLKLRRASEASQSAVFEVLGSCCLRNLQQKCAGQDLNVLCNLTLFVAAQSIDVTTNATGKCLSVASGFLTAVFLVRCAHACARSTLV